MRIALVSREYPPDTPKGGLATQTALKARALAAFGHDVHVMSEARGAELVESTDAGVRVTRIPGFHHRLTVWSPLAEWLTYSALVAEALAARQRESPFDVIDFPEWGLEGFVPLVNRPPHRPPVMVIQLHSPLVMFAHTMQWPGLDSEFYRTGTALEAATLRMADGIYSSSACATGWCSRHYALQPGDVPTIHAGVDVSLFAPSMARKPDRPTIAYAGRIVWNKGVETLVDAACTIANVRPALRLVMAGAAEEGTGDRLRARAAQRGFPDLIELTGHLDHASLAQLLSRAHVFAAPSLYEGGPAFVVLEAMACALPVVASAGSGVAEVISHRETGLLVEPGAVDALAGALQDLLERPADAESMGRRARAWVLANAETHACVRQIEAFYAQVYARVTGVAAAAC